MISGYHKKIVITLFLVIFSQGGKIILQLSKVNIVLFPLGILLLAIISFAKFQPDSRASWVKVGHESRRRVGVDNRNR